MPSAAAAAAGVRTVRPAVTPGCVRPAGFGGALDPVGFHPNPVYLDEMYHREGERYSREVEFLCNSLKYFILGLLVICTISLLIWSVFHPTFPQLNVASADISPIAVTSAVVTAQCNITLLLTNPNRHLTAVYDGMNISLLYPSQQAVLSQFHQPRIEQPKRSQMTFETNLSFSAVNLSDSVIQAIKEDLDRSSLGFVIKISAPLKYKSGKWKSRSHFMRAHCGGVSFGFPSSNKSGIFLNPYQQCEVYVFSK